MDRVIVKPGQVPGDTDILAGQRYAMSALGAALQMLVGTGTIVDGLACTPGTGVAVNIGQGAIYSVGAIDATAYGSLAADTGQIIKQGLVWGQNSVPLTAPTTPGQSVVWLIEAQFQETDGGAQSLPFYNSANPLQPIWTNTNTLRRGACVLQAKAGAAATTGTQVAPTADAGWTPLYAVTLAQGAIGIVAGNIAVAAGAPFLQTKLPNAAGRSEVQNNSLTYSADIGTAGVYQATYTPAITTLVDGMTLEFQVLNANPGAATFAPNGLPAKPIIGGAHAALQGGEFAAGGKAVVMWHAGLNSWILLEATGGAVQIGTATQSSQAPTLAQVQALLPKPSDFYFYGQL